MTPEQERAYQIGIEALSPYRTEPYGDLRLNAERASAKVVMALSENGLVIVDSADLDAYVNRVGGANVRREVDGLNALLAALETETPDV